MGRLKNTCSTLWYSASITVKSLLKGKQPLFDHHRAQESDFREYSELFEEPSQFWAQLEEMETLLDPLCEVIAICESNDTNVSKAYNALLNFGKICYDASECPIMAWGCFSLMAYLNQLDESPIYIAFYVLDPRYRAAFITEAGVLFTVEALTDVALSMGIPEVSIRAM